MCGQEWESRTEMKESLSMAIESRTMSKKVDRIHSAKRKELSKFRCNDRFQFKYAGNRIIHSNEMRDQKTEFNLKEKPSQTFPTFGFVLHHPLSEEVGGH
jgi:hypothetical protein